MAEGGYLLGLIDDYFPDYQFGCDMITLLNNHMAKGSGESRFFCAVFGVSADGYRLTVDGWKWGEF